MERFESASSCSYVDTYCRLAGQPSCALDDVTPAAERRAAAAHPDTSSDEAIARALALDSGTLPPPPPDTRLDAELALQAHQDEVDRLCGHDPPDVSIAAELDRLIRSQLSGSRLLQLVPRLNPAPAAAPGAAGASRDRDRLLHRLAFYGLAERQVQGDGNCQFGALSDQLFRSPAHHAAVRSRVVARLRERPDRYAPFVTEPYDAYVEGMARPGAWGDHVTLQAAADAWGIKIFLVTSFLESCVIAIDPEREDPAFSARTLHLSFWAEVHYNSLYPREDKAARLPHQALHDGLRHGLEGLRAILG